MRKAIAVLVLALFLLWLVPIPILAATVPSVTTGEATNILRTTATLSATITSVGSSNVTTRGVQYGLTKMATWDEHETGSFSAGAYSLSVTGLTPGTTYWYRAYATSAAGTGYGSWILFDMKDYPVISAMDAGNLAGTSARLNCGLTFDGNDDCTITFGWGLTSQAAVGAYDSYQTVSGTYNTGQYPYLDVSDLLPGQTYYFRALATNVVGTRTGDESTFETPMTLLAPTNLIGYPEATSISLSWNKGAGTTNTLVRYSQTGYPTSITDGTQAYFGTGSTYTLTGLTSGKTYYFAVWGETGGDYSTDYVTILMTTTATSTTTPDDLDIPSEPTWWFSTDYTSMSGLGIIYDSLNSAMDTGRLPRATGWFLLAIGLAFLTGLIAYLALGKKLMIAMISMTVVFALEYFAHQIPWWVPLMTLILTIALSQTHKQVAEG